MKTRVYAVITAGGTGRRMGGDIAKQFMEIGGKPILLRTIEMFRALPFEVDSHAISMRLWRLWCMRTAPQDIM